MGLESRADARVRYEFRFPDDRLWVHEVDLAGAGGAWRTDRSGRGWTFSSAAIAR